MNIIIIINFIKFDKIILFSFSTNDLDDFVVFLVVFFGGDAFFVSLCIHIWIVLEQDFNCIIAVSSNSMYQCSHTIFVLDTTKIKKLPEIPSQTSQLVKDLLPKSPNELTSGWLRLRNMKEPLMSLRNR